MSVTRLYVPAVIDTETDPFLSGRVPEPFVAGFFDGDRFIHFWGKDCCKRLMDWLKTQKLNFRIYAHNGGKFDFHFILPWMDDGPIGMIGPRIASCKAGRHRFFDSFCIYPFALKRYNKTMIDYGKMEASERERHKDEIIAYLRDDCVNLYEIVTAIEREFGTERHTVASIAMNELKKFHGEDLESLEGEQDDIFRPFYFGGRCECYVKGISVGPFEVYDVNSMYPYVMRQYEHPVSADFEIVDDIPMFGTYLIDFDGWNNGALPSRDPNGGTCFNLKYGNFRVFSHEFRIAQKLNLIRVDKINKIYVFRKNVKFDQFVTHWYERRQDAKRKKEKLIEQFSKFVLNSAYGKFGQDPSTYHDFYLSHWDPWADTSAMDKWLEMQSHGWLKTLDPGPWQAWQRDKHEASYRYYNVVTAASITSAARAVLLEALSMARGAVYCDTDSIICESFKGEVDPNRLGAWKLEKTAEHGIFLGKKLYGLFNGEIGDVRDGLVSSSDDGEPIIDKHIVALRSKGARLQFSDYVKMARGEEVLWRNDAPTFSISRRPVFLERRIRSTLR